MLYVLCELAEYASPSWPSQKRVRIAFHVTRKRSLAAIWGPYHSPGRRLSTSWQRITGGPKINTEGNEMTRILWKQAAAREKLRSTWTQSEKPTLAKFSLGVAAPISWLISA